MGLGLDEEEEDNTDDIGIEPSGLVAGQENDSNDKFDDAVEEEEMEEVD